MDSSSYMLNFDYGKDAMIKQNMWLETLMRHIPKEAPKTVFLHTPLFVEYPEEVKAAEKEKSLPLASRAYLLDLFDYNNVDTVFSGHTHFENYPDKAGKVRQVVMTSINYLGSWHSKGIQKVEINQFLCSLVLKKSAEVIDKIRTECNFQTLSNFSGINFLLEFN